MDRGVATMCVGTVALSLGRFMRRRLQMRRSMGRRIAAVGRGTVAFFEGSR